VATSTISNTVKDSSGTVIASVPVQVRLMPSGGFRTADFTEVARLVSTTTNSSGFWSLLLERNSTITPANSWYEVTEFVPESAGGKRVWNIAVGASDQNLLASLVTPAQQQPTVVPAGTVYLDQASADARYQAVGSLGSSTPAAETPDLAGTAGVATSASRSDHSHPITAGTPASIGLAGTNSESAGTGFARDTHVHAFSPPTCRVFNNANIAINDAATTVLTFNSERYDPNNMHDTAVNPSRITFATAGVYQVTAVVEITGRADWQNEFVGIKLNGTSFIGALAGGTVANGTIPPVFTVSVPYKFAANDYVEVYVYGHNTAAVAFNAQFSGNYSPEFAATWIGVG
jgi:hypothetical protein